MGPERILWKQCLELVEGQVPLESYSTWFSPTQPHELTEDCLTVEVPNHFYKKCLQENYSELIESSLKSLTGRPIKLNFLVRSDSPPKEDSLDTAVDGLRSSLKAATGTDIRRSPTSTIDQKYRFSNFVVGASNQFAHAAAEAVARTPGGFYNPLFIYGRVGLGKTHLMHAVGNHILNYSPHKRVRYISAESFTVDLIESLRRDDMPAFRNRYRPLDVLFVDDIQFLAGKERTQEEFFYTFKALYESKKQLILSSDRYPKDIHNLEERLLSRLQAGLITDIDVPDLETKVAILYKKAEGLNVTINQEIALFIANHVQTNIRELEGLLLRIVAYASFTQQKIELPLVEEVLKEFTLDKNKHFNIPIILKTVAGFFNIPVSDIKSKKRSRSISIPRQIAMYLCRTHTKYSLPDIGRQFGGKDHTTVIFSYNKISKLVNENNDLSRSVKEITDIIESGKPLQNVSKNRK